MNTTLIREALKYCRERWDTHDGQLLEIDKIDDALKELDTLEGGWIKCSERLPDPGRRCALLGPNNKGIGVRFGEGAGWHWRIFDSEDDQDEPSIMLIDHGITEWTYLPPNPTDQ